MHQQAPHTERGRMNVLQHLQTTCETAEGLDGWQALLEVTHMGTLLVGPCRDLVQT